MKTSNGMNFKKILNQLNIFTQCRKYGVPAWQCPQFLFLIMGMVIIITAITSYILGTHYVVNPVIVALIVLALSAVLFIIAFIIVKSFEKMAEANRMKSEFISVVSHQLRSPLSNLRWTIDLLMSGRLGKIEEKQTEYFRILKENSSRMGELISDLLIISKIETVGLPLKKKEFFLGDLIKELVLEFGPFVRASNIRIKLEIQENLPKILTDFEQIRLVIENLIDNAIRYMPTRQLSESGVPMADKRDKREVSIKLIQKGKNLCFIIRDTGVGIPKQDQKYIFQKFFRSENILKYQTQGSGLGLYIAKSIIKKLGGRIWFKSEEGKGSTFYFTLPIKS